MNLFKDITEDLNRYLLASHMPQGRLWESCFLQETNLGQLIKVLAIEYYRIQLAINQFSNETNIRKTILLIEKWEESVGIPNSCFSVKGVSLEQRRLQIEGIFGNFGGVQTAPDFERVATFFGFTTSVLPGSVLPIGEVFPLTFPFKFSYSDDELGHIILVNLTSTIEGDVFPFEFPFTFGIQGRTFLQCLFDMLAPANVKVIIEII